MGNCWGFSKSSKNGAVVSAPSTNISENIENRTRCEGMEQVYLDGEILSAPNLKVYSFAELKSATRNFRRDTILGEGGFGRVFKGWVDEKTFAPSKVGIGIMVAVKKVSSECMQGLEEWKAQADFLGKFSHQNLVKLIGYCWEDKEFLLVYEFMQKGSLVHHLFRREGSSVQPLPWSIRLKIAIDAARGLAFLHASQKQVIYRDFKASNILIYRDFKASNILLDGDFRAKISDFGWAKTDPASGNSHVTTRIMGTYGYAAPEYVATGHFTLKSDVYGFGVVLLELLTGQRAIDTNRPSSQHNLVEWAKPFLSDRRKLMPIMDSGLKNQFPVKGAVQAAQLTQKCLGPDRKHRPSMKEVFETLVQINAIEDRPKENRRNSVGPTKHGEGRDNVP